MSILGNELFCSTCDHTILKDPAEELGQCVVFCSAVCYKIAALKLIEVSIKIK